MNAYTEDTLVQQTTAEYLEHQLGWRSVLAWNQEDFGPDSLLGRASDKEVVLTRILREKLIELNPGLPNEAYDEAIRQLTESLSSQSIASINRDKHDLLRDGVSVRYQNQDGERVRDRLRVLDFDHPENNDFLCVRELWIKGDLYRRRADIVGFVNGLPLLFMECKNIHRNLKRAFEENYSDYRDTVPHLFHHNAIVMFGNGDESKMGSITSQWGHFHEWKRLAEDDPGVVDMETMLKGVCNKTNFIDLVENFIFFDESSGEPRKIIAKNHQFLGVNRAVEAVRDRETRAGKLGVFWHTQGSGKSYSMVMFTQKVHRKIGGNFTFLMLTDREDLDSQLYKTFAGCGLANNDQDPCRPADGKDLRSLLGQHKSYVFTLIQKFNQNLEDGDFYTDRDDVIIITDEAHRTQGGTLALNLRNAVPNAHFIGFTGTPLLKDDQSTKGIFGDYLSKYDFKRAVDDGATVPLYYDARGDDLNLSADDLNERLAEEFENLEIEDPAAAAKLESELRRDYHILTAGSRLEQVARDFVEHYATGWESGKAMFVCIDKVTCVRMHELITRFWTERITTLEAELPNITDQEDHDLRTRQIEWMKETIAAVVISEDQGEVARFQKWDLDITPHRRLIKDGIELPESMRSRPEYRGQQRMELDEAFKNDDHPFRIAIVCAMWLTGFDVPSLSTLYLDKPLKAHTLMQAIARANRVHEGKNNGEIVDYCGLLRHLRSALADYGTSDGKGDETNPLRPDTELLAELAQAIALVRSYLEERGVLLDAVIDSTGFERNKAISDCKEAANETQDTRKKFELLSREVFKKFKACLNKRPQINQYRNDRDAINIIYKKLQEDREQADITDIIRHMHSIVDEAIEPVPSVTGTRGRINISAIDFDQLKKDFRKSPKPRTTVQNMQSAIEAKLRRLIAQNPLRTDFQKHYDEIVKKYNKEKNRAVLEAIFEELLKFNQSLDEEERRAVESGLDEESLAIFDLLKKPGLEKEDIKKIKSVASDLLETLKTEKLKVDQWRDKESTRNGVKQAIHDHLWADTTGLPTSYSEEEIAGRSEAVFGHVFRVYPTLPSPIYTAA